MFFEELGFTYLGPVDGHSYDELFENMQYAKDERPGTPPRYYEKGKGYKPAETDKTGTWHGTGPYKSIPVILLSRKPLRHHGARS